MQELSSQLSNYGKALRQAYEQAETKSDLLIFVAKVQSCLVKEPVHWKAALCQGLLAAVSGAIPDAVHAANLKELGNTSFRKGDFSEAIKLYTESALFLDEDKQKSEAAVIFSNRANAQLRLGSSRAAGAVEDCTRALVIDPHYAKAQNWLRRAALSIPPDSDLTSKSFDSLQHTLRVRAPRLTVQHVSQEGRSLFARQPIKAGSVIATDSPFVSLVAKGFRKQLCSHCASPLPIAPQPCGKCPLALFCGLRCRDRAGHQAGGSECGVPWTLLLPAEVVLAARCVRFIQSARSKGEDGIADHIDTLESHWQHMAMPRLLDLVLASLLAVCCEKRYTDLAMSCVATGAVAITKAACCVAINGVAAVPLRVTGASDRMALSVYPLLSLFNHSCRPNVAFTFEGTDVIVRATTDIALGAPLWHCYGPQQGQYVTAQRQLLLTNQYHFQCRCLSCSEGSQSAAESMTVGLRCMTVDCGGAVVLCGEDVGIASLEPVPAAPFDQHCTSCKRHMTSTEQQHAIAQLRAACADEKHAATLDAEAAIQVLLKTLQVRRKFLHSSNEVIGATEDALGNLYMAIGNAEAASKHSAAALRIVQQAYGVESITAAHQMRQLAALLRSFGESSRCADQAAHAAQCIFTKHHGVRLAAEFCSAQLGGQQKETGDVKQTLPL